MGTAALLGGDTRVVKLMVDFFSRYTGGGGKNTLLWYIFNELIKCELIINSCKVLTVNRG